MILVYIAMIQEAQGIMDKFTPYSLSSLIFRDQSTAPVYQFQHGNTEVHLLIGDSSPSFGIGKLSASILLREYLSMNSPERIINLGTAGSFGAPLRAPYSISRVVDLDFEGSFMALSRREIQLPVVGGFQELSVYTSDDAHLSSELHARVTDFPAL